jgi:SPX domain protein involved in polyphosphate accumulation
MDAVTTDLTKLAKFNSMNYTAFVKIIKKHDKVRTKGITDPQRLVQSVLAS